MRKKSLKVTLFATLLATVGTLAYAEGENLVVTLKNGDAISWDSFVNAINTGKTDKKFEVTLPDTDPAKVAVANAKAAVTTAEGVVTEKGTAVTTAEGVVTTKKALVAKDSQLYKDSVDAETAVGNAQQAIDNYVKDTIDPKRAAIATANSTIEANTKSISSLQTKQQNLQADLAVATANRTTAKEAVDDAKAAINSEVTALNKELTTLNSQLTVLKDTLTNQNTLLTNLTNTLNSLPKKSGPVGWLKKMISTAADFKTNAVNDADMTSPTIFYQKVDDSEPGDPYFILNMAFLPEKPATGNWEEITPYNFYRMTRDQSYSGYQVYNETYIYIYDINNPTKLVAKNISYTGARSILTNVNSYLDNLSLSSTYQTTTDEVQDTYKARETQLKNYIGTAADGDKPATGLMKRIADQQQLITAKEGVITAKEGEITAKEGELTNPPTGSDLAKAQADYNKYNEQITGENGYNAQLNSVKSQIEGLQNEVDGLNNKLDNPYEENGETVPSLKTQLQNAIDGQATVDAALTAAQNQVKDANAAIAAARAEVTAAEKDVKDAQAALATAEADVVTKEAAVTTAENELESAQTAANEAAAAAYFTANYQDINLNGNLTVESSITEPYSGTIWGNGYIITNKADGPIINNSFKGQLSDVAVNGNFAKSTAGATIDNVVVWTGSEGRVYNENGVATPYTTLAELGYASRSKYGIDFGTDNLVTLSGNSKVFQFTVKNLDADVTNYVVINDGKFMTGANTELPALTNVFAKSTTDDVKDLKLTNVYYGQNNTCYNVEITDGNNFYCPVEIQATNVNYNRQLKKGYNSVCLPFALDPSLLPSAVDAVCKYDRETTEKFWFTKVDGSVDANVPALLHTTEACSINLTGVVLAPTPASQLTTGGTFEGNAYESQSHGTFKRVNAGEFLGASQAGKIYGLQTLENGDYVFKLAVSDGDEASQAHFPAFRMAISSQIVSTESQSLKAPSEYIGVRQIGIRDENGIEITQDFTTRVEDLVADVTSLNINGGIGEIIFASDADYGKVEIFSLDGKVVAIADVIEGKTSVNIQKGLYIVMGKKVLVK